MLRWLCLKSYINDGLPCHFFGRAHGDKIVNMGPTKYICSDLRTCTMVLRSGVALAHGRECFSKEVQYMAGEQGSVGRGNVWHSWCLILLLITSPASDNTHVSSAPHLEGIFCRVRTSKCWCRTTVLTSSSKRKKKRFFILEPIISEHVLETVKFSQIVC